MRTLVTTALLAAAAVTAAASERTVDTVVVTAKPARTSVPAVPKALPATKIEVASPIPTDMPEAEVDYQLPHADVASASVAEKAQS